MSSLLGKVVLFTAAAAAGLAAWLMSTEREDEEREKQAGWEGGGTRCDRNPGITSYYEDNNIRPPRKYQVSRRHRRYFDDDDEDYNVSNPHNNHDHRKRPHSTREAAEREVQRMQLLGVEECERLNVYKNEQLGCWFVGRSKW